MIFFGGIFFLIGYQDHSPLLMAIGVVTLGIFVACWIIISKIVVTIHDEGIRRTTMFGVREITWRDVAEYRFRAVPMQGAGHAAGGLIGVLIVAAMRRAKGREAVTSIYLDVIGRDGTKIRLGSGLRDAYDAVGGVVAKIHEQMRPAVNALVGSTGAEFGPLRLTIRDVQWKQKEPVAIREIERAELAGAYLRIKKQGKFLSLVSVRSDKIPNVLLFLEELERLGGGGTRGSFVDPLAHFRG